MNLDRVLALINNNYRITGQHAGLNIYEYMGLQYTAIKGKCCPYCGSPVKYSDTHMINGYIYYTAECGVMIAPSTIGLVGLTSQTQYCAMMMDEDII